MATLALSVPVTQPHPLQPIRRDISATQGDDLTLAFTIYDTDDAASPKDVTGATLRFRAAPPGGPPGGPPSEIEVSGSIISAAGGRMNVALTDLLADLYGEFRWQALFTLSSVSTTICGGAFIVRPEAPAT